MPPLSHCCLNTHIRPTTSSLSLMLSLFSLDFLCSVFYSCDCSYNGGISSTMIAMERIHKGGVCGEIDTLQHDKVSVDPVLWLAVLQTLHLLMRWCIRELEVTFNCGRHFNPRRWCWLISWWLWYVGGFLTSCINIDDDLPWTIGDWMA